jgi:transposase
MVHRREFHSGQSSRRRRFKKSLARWPQEPADHALGRSRGGFGSKFHMATDGSGLPLAIEVSAGQCHESKWFEPVMNAVRIPQPSGRPRRRPGALAGDKGYSCRWIRDWLRQHRIRAVIPRKSNEIRDGRQAFNKDDYRRRNVVECCIGWLKECRRIATRFEKLAVNFLAMLKLAIIEQYLRYDFSDRA